MVIRSVFSWIDFLVRWTLVEIIDLVFRISEVNIIKDTAIKEFTIRIYGILGIIILFKIVISAVQYLVSPDKLLDKDKGIGGLLQRTVISVALLGLVPVIFDFAGEVQKYVSNAIPQIILGQTVSTDNDGGVSDTRLIAEKIASMTLKVFITDSEGNPVDLGDTYSEQLTNEKLNSGCDWLTGWFNCDYNYNYLLSILVAGFMVYIFLSMGIDIGIRAIKMGILEILAPIPISSYINSEENFKAWYQMAFKVYADLFIRLILIYFIIYLVDLVLGGGIDISGQERKFWQEPFLSIYIIVALFVFAKSAPKFISEALGLKGDGFGDMAEMFKPAWSRAGGTFAAGTGMVSTGLGNMINRAANTDWKKGGIAQKLKNAAGVLGSGVAGATSAGLRGGWAAIQGKSWSEVNAAGAKRAVIARQNHDRDRADGVTTWNRMVARAQDFMGLDTSASLAEGRQSAYSTIHTDVGNFKKAVMGRITKTANVALTEGAGSASHELGQLLARNMDAIMASGNNDLIGYTRRFDIRKDSSGNWVCDGLKTDAHISYHDLAAITADATQCGIGSISALTREEGALTLQAQKELFAASMSGQIVDMNGNGIDQLNVGNPKTHVDIATAVGLALQHITENAVSLGEFTSDIRYTDENGEVRIADSDHPVRGSEMFINAFTTDFGKLDDVLQRRSSEISSKMSTDPGAAARASIQRRDGNNNSGK